MTSGPIGEAHVLIVPDLTRFGQELKAKLAASVATVKDPQISVDAVLDKSSIAKVVAETKAVAKAADPKIQVKAEVDRNAFQNLLKKAITPHPELFQALRAPLARGLSTPLGAAITAALTVTLLPAIASAITGGLGLGLVALGAFALRGSTILKQHFKAAGSIISESLRQAALPLRGPFLQAIKSVGVAMLRLQPQFRNLFEGLAPAIKPFVDGLTGFVQQLLPNLQAAMPGINAAFAEFGARLPGLGSALGGVFAAISENIPAIQRGIGIIFTLSETLLRVAGGLLTLGQAASGVIATALHPVGTAIGFVKEHVLGLDRAQQSATLSRDGLTEAEYAALVAERLAAAAKEENAKKAGELTTQLKRLKEGYQQEVASIRATIEGYKGLVTQSGVTASEVIKDLGNQVANFKTYSTDVRRLIKAGVSPDAIQELSKKGPQYVHALATGTNTQLQTYKRYWKERQAEVKGKFQDSVDAQYAHLKKQMKKMQEEINKLKGKTVAITASFGFKTPPKVSIHDIVGNTSFKAPKKGAARGMRITEGSGPTADDVLLRVSKGETVVSARDSSQPEFMAWARQRRIPGYASGGRIGAKEDRADSLSAFSGAMRRFEGVIDQVIRNLATKFGKFAQGFSLPAASHAAGSWKIATNFLTKLGIPFKINSTFRPGARTHASGRQSYHALNRAVDLGGPDKLAIWKALVPTNPTELIYSRAPRYKSRGGWKPISRLDPITKADHYDHVHAAYDKGGLLMPGITMAENRTGRPEMVTPAGRDALGRVRFGGGGMTVQNLIVQPLSGQFRLRDVMTELQLQGVH